MKDLLPGLPANIVATLRLRFECRHILEHNGGVADGRYVKDSGDSLPVGRRVRFDAGFVRRFMGAIAILADALETTAA